MTRCIREFSVARLATSLMIPVRGCNAIKDVDLALLFGVRLADFYDRIGGKLWCFEPTSIFKLPQRYARAPSDQHPILAFDSFGVRMIAAILGDDNSIEISLDIVSALESQWQTPADTRRLVNRVFGPDKVSRAYEAKADRQRKRLHGLLTKKIKKQRY